MGWECIKALARAAVQPVRFTVHSADPKVESFTLRAGARVFHDAPFEIQELATELEGVRGIRFSHAAAKSGRYTPLEFSTDVPVRVLIGYVRADGAEWRKPPRSEFDAAAAERGGTEPLILAAAKISGLPPIDVYELSYPAGRHKIEPPGSGSFLVLGIVAAAEPK